ncbi:hypothetical protein OHO28_20795 [Streptomyces europaeiscabiei]|uniref:hypothetical protein n=1 Tax=Streptomyces europaeiscabiei TaxID=146819 RepID=UPI002E1813C8
MSDSRGPQRTSSPTTPPIRSVSPWRSLLTHGVAVLLGLAIGGGIALAAGDDSKGGDTTRPAATITATETATAMPEAAATPSGTPAGAAKKPTADEIPGDGTFIVGEDIEPGTYRSDGPQGGVVTHCSWERLSGTGRDAEDIIAANGGSGQDTVTVEEGDRAFSTSGCKPWKRVG